MADPPPFRPLKGRDTPAMDALETPLAGNRLRRRFQKAKLRLRGAVDLVDLAERGVRIGRGVFIGPGSTIDLRFPWLVSIGDESTIAPGVTILAHDGSTKRLCGYTRIAPVVIGDRVFVGTGVVILPGITVGDDAIIGAGSVVRHDVPARTIVAGNPARPIASTDEYVELHREQMEGAPRYGREYTLAFGITREQKLRMREELRGRAGYVL